MKRILPFLVVLAFVGLSPAAGAQTTAKTPVQSKSTVVAPRDSVTIADVQRAADELARTVQAAVKQISENPELKVAALKLATQSVNAAQIIVNSQAATLQSVLDSLAKEVAAASISIEKSKPKTH